MKTILDLSTWARKEHFHFFRKFEEPFFGITAKVDCTEAYASAKNNEDSFFLSYLHKALVAANNVEPFKYRISDDEVYIYDEIHGSPTINRPDGTFGFSYIKYLPDFKKF
ncbi:MAG: CatA-like O-acetyltransferase, partial [Leeuwenhoekiella sp.]